MPKDKIPLSNRTPLVTAMVLCDDILQDSTTRKKSLIGVFNRIAGPSFPTQHNLALFMELTDAVGHYQFRVQLVHLDTEQTVGQTTSNIMQVTNPLGSFDLSLKIPAMFPQPGRYAFRLFANDAYVGQKTLEVVQMQRGEKRE